MSASKVLDLAERQGLLDAKAIGELRKQVAESKFVVTPEAVAKLLVDQGHLTAFQARRLVASALEEPDVPSAQAAPAAPPSPAEKPAARARVDDTDSLLADMELPPFYGGPAKEPEKTQPAPPAAAPPPRKAVPAKPSAAKPPPPPEPPKAAPPKPRPAPPRPRSVPAPELTPVGAGAVDSGLTPLAPATGQELGGLTPLESTLTPLGTADALSPLSPFAQPQAPIARKEKKGTSYSLILILFTALGVLLIPFALLTMWSLYGGTADLFKRAEEEYANGALGNAMALYDKFLESDPADPEGSTARVRRNMAELRQVSGEGTNPRPGLVAAQRLLPEMEKEAEFNIIRVELRSILVDIAYSFASQATAAKETAKKQELVGLTEEAMKLVDNPSYLPATFKAEVMPRINQVADRLKAARRSIDQDNALVKALAEIRAASDAGDAIKAYKIRTDLLKAFPAVEADATLAEATGAIGQMEQKQVKVQRDSLAASTDDPAPIDARVLLASREGAADGLEGTVVILVQGALYGLEAKSGKVNWRRFVGYETMFHPVPLSRDNRTDVIAVDARKNEIYRLGSSTNKLVWKLAVGQPFAAPTVTEERIYATTRDGRILDIDAKTGNCEQQAQLPQKPGVPLAAAGGALYQPGDHSTLFVLSADSLQCTQTLHVGHRAGAIVVPPVAVLGHILVVENPADDYAVVHMFAPQGPNRALEQLPDPLRLKGRVVMPMMVDRNRVVIVTDLGQITVLQVDASNKARPIRTVGTSEAIEKAPVMSFHAVDAGMVYVAGQRLSGYEIQGSQQKLSRKWTVATDDDFVAPPQVRDNVVIHARRRRGSLATTVQASSPADGSALWTVDIAAPLAALFPSEARKQIVAVSSRGRVYELSAETISTGYSDAPSFIPLPGTEGMSLTDGILVGNDKWACLGMRYSGHYLVYDNAASSGRTKQHEAQVPPGEATAPSVPFRGGVAVPLHSGRVMLINPDTGRELALPFQPALQASARLGWTQPAVLTPDGSVLAIADGANTIYRLTIKNEPRPHLESLGETVVDSDVISPLAVAGDTLYAVTHGMQSDVLVSFQGADLQPGPKYPLAGRLTFGPVATAGVVFVADDQKLHCYAPGGNLRWSIPLAHGLPTAPPIVFEQDFVIVTRAGAVYRVSQDKGEETGLVETGEPLGMPASLFNGRLLASGPDGVIHLVPLPKRP